MTSERLITLMELLQVYAHQYVQKAYNLNLIEESASNGIEKTNSHFDFLMSTLSSLREMCQIGELPVTLIPINTILLTLERDGKVDGYILKKFLTDIHSRFVDELSTKVFFQLPHSRKEMFEKARSKWEPITERWPETIGDIIEANKCFALSRYAASVFHCIQVIEIGLIKLGEFLHVNDPISGWTAVSNELKRIINKKYQDRSDSEKQHFAFIEQMQGTVEALKNAWRNKISHAHGKLTLLGADFTPEMAEEIMTASRSFMRRLAEELPV